LGLPADYLRSYRTRLAAVTPAQLQATARQLVRADAATIVVVGDATQIHSGLSNIAPVRMVSVEGAPLTPDDLVIRAAAADLDASKLVARTDSFTILVQGNPMGWQRATLEKTAGGYRYVEDAQIGPILRQTTELTFTDDLEMRQVKQTGKVQGQDTNIDVTYAGGRAKGSAVTPSPAGIQPVTVDAEVPAGVLDGNAIAALLPAFRWAPNAKFTIPVFSSGRGQLREVTLTVAGKDSVTVPAGTLEVYRVDLTGGEQPATFFITTAEPWRVARIVFAGAPIEIVRVK
ncbi:MAG: DUF3108 domain-containing protein, partial [Gemmatimonadaceae bacterium]